MTNPNPNPEVNPVINPEVAPVEPIKAPTETMIPKHRFDEVYEKMKQMSATIEAFEAEKATKEKEELEKKNEFETLYKQSAADLEKYKQQATGALQQATEYETLLNGMVEAKLSNVPEDFKELIPAGLTTTQKLDWLNKAEAKGLFTTGSTNIPVGTPVQAPVEVDYTQLSASELLKMAYTKK